MKNQKRHDPTWSRTAVGRIGLLAGLLLALMLGWKQAGVAATGPMQSEPPRPGPADSAPQDATDEWWASAWANIQADLAPNGLSATADWTADGQNSNDNFAKSVASAGDVNGDGYADVIVGAYNYDSLTGRAYVFYGSASGLSAAPNWTATGEDPGDNFGNSVAGAGDVNGDGYADIVIGVPGAFSGEGKISLYQGSATGVEAGAAWSGIGRSWENDEGLGWSVAGAGDVNGDGYADIVAGVFDHDEGIGQNQGRVYVYYGPVDLASTYGDWVYTGAVLDCNMGRSVAGAGDVNGDGYSDLIVGAANCSSNRGTVHFFYGSASGPGSAPDWSLLGENTGDWFGKSVAGLGDVDGDGYGEVAVGASGFSSNQGRLYAFRGGSGDGYGDVVVGARDYDDDATASPGKAYVYYGNVAGLSTNWDWAATGSSDGEDFGVAVAGAGDVNGDGYADVIVGASDYSPTGQPSAGQASLFLGSDSGPGNAPVWTADGEAGYDFFGRAVAGAGDVNGDGYADVVVGAYGYDLGAESGAGRAYVYHGSATGFHLTWAWSSSGWGSASGQFGWSVAGAGDVNGDSYADLFVGAPGHNGGRGVVLAYYGGSSGLSLTSDWALIGSQPDGFVGSSVAGAGDVNGDGYADVICGARGDGWAYVSVGRSTGLATSSPLWAAAGENSGDEFGGAVAGAGDVNGDGYADLVVGAPEYGTNQEGRAYVYLGNDGGGRQVRPQPARADGSRRPVQPWGLSYAADGFYLSLSAIHPLGRERAKIEIEACPPGAPFGDATCIHHRSTAWKDTTATRFGVRVATTISRLEAETLYRWRARALYAPYTVTQSGITPPRNPAHGPWRRFQGQVVEADLRTMEAVTTIQVFLPLVQKGY